MIPSVIAASPPQVSGLRFQVSELVVVRNELVLLQLAIARRADHLARLVISDPATDVALWLQAEEEILAAGRAPLRGGVDVGS